jgi:hypothetical protein
MGREGLLIGSLGGVIALATLTLMLGAAVGGVLYEPEIAALLRRLARRVVPPPEPPEGQPIERIARDARRLRGAVLACTPGTPMARRVAAVQAYDDRLVEACRALGVPDTLTGLPPGARRDAERLHVEYLLGEAGLNLGT